MANRLLNAYDAAGQNIEKPEKDVAHRKASAKAKVESARKTEMRRHRFGLPKNCRKTANIFSAVSHPTFEVRI